MAITLNVRPGLGRRHRAARKSTTQTITIPDQPTAIEEHYTWAVNAAVEAGQLDLADDIAASYALEA